MSAEFERQPCSQTKLMAMMVPGYRAGKAIDDAMRIETDAMQEHDVAGARGASVETQTTIIFGGIFDIQATLNGTAEEIIRDVNSIIDFSR